ncbi:MAG TPA: energy transducer TonB [Candidatus Sulfotelmatobacter sp.]
MKSHLYLLVFLFLVQFSGASNSLNQQEIAARLGDATSKTNIFELPSFVLNTNVQIELGGKLVDGDDEPLWNGPDQWREGIRVPGYTEVQIGGKGTVWVQRSTDFLPLPIFNLHQALGFGSNFNSPFSPSLVQPVLGSRDTIQKEREKKEHGDKLTCFEIEHVPKNSSEVCIDDVSGTIRRSSFGLSDSDFQPVGTKTFPRILVLNQENHVTAKVNVTKLSSPAQFPPGAFAPPSGVSPETGCMNPLVPQIVDKESPKYPETARQQYREGTVTFDVLIGKEGTTHLRHLLKGAGSDLDESARSALSHWRYDPARCNGQPVQVETVLQVNYTLSRH